MLTTMETCLRKSGRNLRRCLRNPGFLTGAKVLAWGGGGFFLSGAALQGSFQPLAMGMICSVRGWQTGVMTLGAMAGYWLFWGRAGLQGAVWAAVSCLLTLLESHRQRQDMPLFLPALLGVTTAACGVGFLFFQEPDPVPLFFLRVGLAPVSGWFFRRATLRRDSLSGWICGSVGVLALGALTPLPWLNLGCLAAGAITVWACFPAAALAAIGLELARVSALPLSAALCGGWFARMLPFEKRWMRSLTPAAGALVLMALTAHWDPAVLPGLLLGGFLGYLLPPRANSLHRRDRAGIAQVRLELTAGVLSRTQQFLLECSDPPVDEEEILRQIIHRVCTGCVYVSGCREKESLAVGHLRQPASFTCRRHGEIQFFLEQGRSRMLTLKADRQRRQEYRGALIQQYQFLAAYLRKLSDQLPRQPAASHSHYRLEVSARSRGKHLSNGDSCLAFPGTGCRYYVLLCDGMGTGMGADEEGRTAGRFLKTMLTAGFPPEHALRSVNSILALGSRAGAVTVDLAEARLDSGQVRLYKWGAAPSYILRRSGTEKIGTAGPPPGICVTEARETVFRLSLRRGEVLILLSDGVQAGECLKGLDPEKLPPPGELAQRIIEECCHAGEDDGTAAVLRLHPRRTVP